MSVACLADALIGQGVKTRLASESYDPGVFTDIYTEQTNIAIWRRKLPSELVTSLETYLRLNPQLSITRTIEADAIEGGVADILPDFPLGDVLRENIAELIDMFCCLFDLPRAGLRLKVLEHAMCPRFHVDRIPCRLVTTYCGSGTQWWPQHLVNRDKLGAKSQGQPDENSGLYEDAGVIQQLAAGDVALLKEELWEGNEHAGLVHRSPSVRETDKRLLLTLDFVF